MKELGDLVKILVADDPQHEVDMICSEIEHLVHPKSKSQYRDISIMFRVRKVTSELEMEFFRRGIPYFIKKEQNFL